MDRQANPGCVNLRPTYVRAALFGSRARDDNRPGSDTDVLMEIDPEPDLMIWDSFGSKQFVASLFEGPVDAIGREALNPYMAPATTVDAVYVF